jgi:hypothetical protein
MKAGKTKNTERSTAHSVTVVCALWQRIQLPSSLTPQAAKTVNDPKARRRLSPEGMSLSSVIFDDLI